MSKTLDVDQERLRSRNLTLAIQTEISCGHAMRVTLADLLQDLEDLRGDAGSHASYLCESLERALADDIQQNLRVANLLGLNVPPKEKPE
ncbi:hypothetical protein [Neorhizobium vignae]|uniref:hypothetical protein n=1 Tax=Neorhizobium vignae TaxID=690585 RepID=UPI001268B7EE|nr:hypothetical protein [Neorhizobium vignae]